MHGPDRFVSNLMITESGSEGSDSVHDRNQGSHSEESSEKRVRPLHMFSLLPSSASRILTNKLLTGETPKLFVPDAAEYFICAGLTHIVKSLRYV
jgi:hypothetical protein